MGEIERYMQLAREVRQEFPSYHWVYDEAGKNNRRKYWKYKVAIQWKVFKINVEEFFAKLFHKR